MSIITSIYINKDPFVNFLLENISPNIEEMLYLLNQVINEF